MKKRLAGFCGGGAVLSAAFAHSGWIFPPTVWATLGASVFGAWMGYAVFRLTDDPFDSK